MDGDLNLSQALGGLRIANQADDSPPPSPRSGHPAHLPSETRSDLNSEPGAATIHIPDLHTLDTHNLTAPTAHAGSQKSSPIAPSASTHSLPLPSPASSTQLPSVPPDSSSQLSYQPQPRSTYPQPSSRHSTQFLPNYTNVPSPYQCSGSVSGSGSVDYRRLSREPSRSSLSGPPLGPRHSQRERPGTDRSYRQSQPSGPYPSRSNPAAEDGGTACGDGSPYNLEDGPPKSSDEWIEKGAAVLRHKEIDANGNTVVRVVKKGVKDFNFGRTLGEGSYSTVLAATDRTTLKEYAIKVLDKRHIIKEDKVKYVNIEKNTLNRLGEHPGVVRLYYTFQDERSLYFVLDLATGGELLSTLKRMVTFDEECSRYYAAQILDTVEYMHSKGVIHRDLKPENVLLDDKMRVKITDFGTAKILDEPPRNGGLGNGVPGDQMEGHDNSRANSFVGTAEYVSPELLRDKSACKASDLWAFGCIIYQFFTGRPPFKASNEYQTFEKIVHLEYEFPKGFPPVARDLVERLLVLDPAQRLSIEHIKNHPFFEGIEWGRKLWVQKAPRLKSYTPPPEDIKIIKLNDLGAPNNATLRNGAPNGRPMPRVITELPPPSQLDIEWSPVLTRANERILKLGNAVVQTSPAPHSPDGKGGVNGHDAPRKFSRFFGGSTTKKRQRLIMITSAARLVIAPAGGDEKKPKSEINLQGIGVVVRKLDSGSTSWAVDTRDKCYTFEDPKTPASEWLEQIEKAREMASVNYPPDDGFMPSALSSPASSLTLDKAANTNPAVRGSDAASERSSKRFSKRTSRHGLAAVF